MCLYHKTCISIYRAHIFNVPGACAREGAARAVNTKKQANAFHTDSIFMFIFCFKKYLDVIISRKRWIMLAIWILSKVVNDIDCIYADVWSTPPDLKSTWT